MRQLKDGIRRGNYYCYCEMALLYAREGHGANFAKAWDLFFARRADSYREEVEAGELRYARGAAALPGLFLDLGLTPAHMTPCGWKPSTSWDAAARTDPVRDAPQDRQRLANAVYWSYEHLLPPRPAITPLRRWRLPWAGRARGATAQRVGA